MHAKGVPMPLNCACDLRISHWFSSTTSAHNTATYQLCTGLLPQARMILLLTSFTLFFYPKLACSLLLSNFTLFFYLKRAWYCYLPISHFFSTTSAHNTAIYQLHTVLLLPPARMILLLTNFTLFFYHQRTWYCYLPISHCFSTTSAHDIWPLKC
jgi:hypothetical protein